MSVAAEAGPHEPVDGERVKARAEALSPEEQRAGSDDPEQQAEAILADSDTRTDERTTQLVDAERRHSDDTVEPEEDVVSGEEP